MQPMGSPHPSTDMVPFLQSSNPPPAASKISTAGKILIGISGGVALGLSIICVPFVSPALRKYCLPYIPATNTQVKNVFEALAGRGGGTLIDLGSGDGRIVIEGAKHNFQSCGVELNPWLVWYSKVLALREGCYLKVKFFRKDLWKVQFHMYDNIVIFGVEQMMDKLGEKLLEECRENCNIVACRFPLPNMTPCKTIGSGVDTVWLYKIP